MESGTDRYLRMLSAALEMEEKGKDFYEKSVSACHNALERNFFKQMIAEEGRHHAALSDLKLYLSDPPPPRGFSSKSIPALTGLDIAQECV